MLDLLGYHPNYCALRMALGAVLEQDKSSRGTMEFIKTSF